MTSDPRFTEEVDVVSVGAERPRQLFEQGSMVEVKGYGYGVVQWLGNLSGRETAGVELVRHTHIVQYVPRPLLRRSTESCVVMEHQREGRKCCFHASQVMVSSALSQSSFLTPDSPHWRPQTVSRPPSTQYSIMSLPPFSSE